VVIATLDQMERGAQRIGICKFGDQLSVHAAPSW
jgi:hypothetical protein